MRGFAAIGLDHPKTPENVGSALRACQCYGASMMAVAGKRFKRASTDTFQTYRHMPVLEVEDLKLVIPFDCVPVAVDLIPGAQCLTTYKHPERAFYIFGPEDGTLGERVLSWCRDVVYVPTDRCMNLAATVNVILYDRAAKMKSHNALAQGREHSERPAVPEWQPIETAPKDGRNMLLFGRWWSDEQGRMKEPLIGQWNTARDRWEFANAEGWWGIRPGWWMPLPDTPSNAKLTGLAPGKQEFGAPLLRRKMKTEITLTITCGEKTCGECQYKAIFRTGIGEFHPKCELFDNHYGNWGEVDMRRSRKCVAAQRKAASRSLSSNPPKPKQEKEDENQHRSIKEGGDFQGGKADQRC